MQNSPRVQRGGGGEPPATPTAPLNSLSFRDAVISNADSEMSDLSEDPMVASLRSSAGMATRGTSRTPVLVFSGPPAADGNGPGTLMRDIGNQQSRRSRGCSLTEMPSNRGMDVTVGSSSMDPAPLLAAPGLDSGNHSSEEELEEINMTKDYRPGPEKRKWCDLSHSEASSESDFELNELCNGTSTSTSVGNNFPPSIETRSASATSADSSCDTPSGDEDQNHNKMLPTPLEFSTSPPIHVYRPRKSHNFTGCESSGGSGGGVAAERKPANNNAFNQQHQQQHPPTTSQVDSVEAGSRVGKTDDGRAVVNPQHRITRFSSSLDDLRHLHGSKKPASPRKKTRRIQLIQRPCLDFEKMQQLRGPGVTDWRPAGELSLFCW